MGNSKQKLQKLLEDLEKILPLGHKLRNKLCELSAYLIMWVRNISDLTMADKFKKSVQKLKKLENKDD